jgi:hypothetical protein
MRRARLGLAAFVGAVVLCVGVAESKDPNPPFVPPPGATTDLDVFRKVVTRVRAGDSFYEATQEEFRSHGYPTRSVFNWRTPAYAWFIGRVTGDDLARALLMVGVVLAVVMGSRDLLDDGGMVSAAVGAVFFVGATAWCFGGETFLFTEVWAGMLIALSLGALQRGWTAVGVLTGLAAVFYRELALPYAVVALAVAAWNGRKREALAWGVGLALFAAFLAGHASVVHARLTPADQALDGGWLRFGGVRFLLLTAQTNVFLMPLPLWATAVYLPLACLGLFGMRGESGQRVALTLACYLAAFSVVGNPFNFYWGFITAPLLALALAHAPRTLRALLDAAFPHAAPVRPALSGLGGRA